MIQRKKYLAFIAARSTMANGGVSLTFDRLHQKSAM